MTILPVIARPRPFIEVVCLSGLQLAEDDRPCHGLVGIEIHGDVERDPILD